MKRLLSVCVLILCLSFSASAGHSVIGGWCECGTPACLCDPGEQPLDAGSRSVPDKSSKKTPSDLGSETLLVLGVLLLMLRYKA
jgi:hypothetical protein